MAYTKTNWVETTPRSLANLNNMETQYDEAIAQGESLREDNTKALRAQVSATVLASGVAGQLYFNSTNGQMYVYNGTAWVHLGPNKIEKEYNGIHTVSGTSTTINLPESFEYADRACIYNHQHQGGSISSEDMNTLTWSDSDKLLAQAYQSGGGADLIIRIVQFYPGVVKSLQRKVVQKTSVGTETIDTAISSVDTNKTLLLPTFRRIDALNLPHVRLTSSTNMATTTGNTFTMHIEIVEFY